MQIDFVKMHGTGNDFIVLDAISQSLPEDLNTFSKKVCDRHFGIGADQVLIVYPSSQADIRMDIYNADGGKVEMCGNGIRCFAKYVFEKQILDKNEFTVETLGGVIKPKILSEDPSNFQVQVDMGEPITAAEKIPTTKQGELINYNLELNDEKFNTLQVTCVSMGNPHTVVFVENVTDFPVERIGKLIQGLDLFPNQTNVEFVEVVDEKHLIQRTWERGSGETYACGTGASAVCVAAVLNHRTERSVKIKLKGGSLQVNWDENTNHVFKIGPAETVFTGTIEF